MSILTILEILAFLMPIFRRLVPVVDELLPSIIQAMSDGKITKAELSEILETALRSSVENVLEKNSKRVIRKEL